MNSFNPASAPASAQQHSNHEIGTAHLDRRPPLRDGDGDGGRQGGPGGATRAALVVALLALLPIAVLMLVQVRRGAWQNVDASNARERPALFMVSAAGLALLLAYSLAVHPQAFLVRGAIGTLAM